MNVERFAGDNQIMQAFAVQMQNNKALSQQRQRSALDNAYQQRARDVGATGVKGPGRFL
tara:strand:- start:142 stop:318 length:177 start_codon:yes stop_codon:yes gene_type:complete